MREPTGRIDPRNEGGVGRPLEQDAQGFAVPAPEPTPPGPAPLRPAEIIRVPARHNPILQAVLSRINADEDLHALWRSQNITAVDRLGMSDHGPVHMQIASNIALRLLRLLIAHGLTPSVVADHGLTNDDAEVVVVLAVLLHDAGMSVHREDHEAIGLFIAHDKLRELLRGIYQPAAARVVLSETLHAIMTHRSGSHPLTLEAGVVRLADALDMAKGRSRIPFEAGHVNIHSVSAAAIDNIEVGEGEEKPIRIAIHMLNAAGLYQLDELLKEKLHHSGLEPYVEIVADVIGEADKRLFQTFRI